MNDLTATQQFWDREVVQPTHSSWMADPTVREYINALIGGADPAWPIDWFETSLRGRRFERALSIGCGTGPLERDLIQRGLCKSIDAFDGSVVSLRTAENLSKEAGAHTRIHYFAMDFNEPSLPRKAYDAVFFHQSAHHVAKLEKLFRAVLLALIPDGILYLDEYVGPSRHEWTTELLKEQVAAYQATPEGFRTVPNVPLPIQEDDPSEAFRSSEIIPQLRVGFDIIAVRPYGGNILSVLYPILRQPSAKVIDALLTREKNLLAAGVESFYQILVCKPKPAVKKFCASWQYFVEPKLKRAVREVKVRFAKST